VNDKKLVLDAKRAIAKLSAEVLSVTKMPRNGHWLFLVKLPGGEEKEFRLSGSPTDHHGAPLAMAKDVKRYISGYYPQTVSST
jgi:hypothetical protein